MPGIKPVVVNKPPSEILAMYNSAVQPKPRPRALPGRYNSKPDTALQFGRIAAIPKKKQSRKKNSQRQRRDEPTKAMQLKGGRLTTGSKPRSRSEKTAANVAASAQSSAELDQLRAEIDLMDRVKEMLLEGRTEPDNNHNNNSRPKVATPRQQRKNSIPGSRDGVRGDPLRFDRSAPSSRNGSRRGSVDEGYQYDSPSVSPFEQQQQQQQRQYSSGGHRDRANKSHLKREDRMHEHDIPPAREDKQSKSAFASFSPKRRKQLERSFGEESSAVDGFFKWGQPGAGAPIRNKRGKIETSRQPNLYDNLSSTGNVDVDVYSPEKHNAAVPARGNYGAEHEDQWAHRSQRTENAMRNSRRDRPSSGPVERRDPRTLTGKIGEVDRRRYPGTTSKKESLRRYRSHDDDRQSQGGSLPAFGIHDDTTGPFKRILAPPGGKSHFQIGGNLSPVKDKPQPILSYDDYRPPSVGVDGRRRGGESRERRLDSRDDNGGFERPFNSTGHLADLQHVNDHSTYGKGTPRFEHQADRHVNHNHGQYSPEHEQHFNPLNESLHADVNGSYRKIIAPPGGKSHFQIGSMEAQEDAPPRELTLADYRPPSVGVDGRMRGGESRERPLSGQNVHNYSPARKLHSKGRSDPNRMSHENTMHGRSKGHGHHHRDLSGEFNRVVEYEQQHHHHKQHATPKPYVNRESLEGYVDEENMTQKERARLEQKRMLEEQIRERDAARKKEAIEARENSKRRISRQRAKARAKEEPPKSFKHPHLALPFDDHEAVEHSPSRHRNGHHRNESSPHRHRHSPQRHHRYEEPEELSVQQQHYAEEEEAAEQARTAFDEMQQELAEVKAQLLLEQRQKALIEARARAGLYEEEGEPRRSSSRGRSSKGRDRRSKKKEERTASPKIKVRQKSAIRKRKVKAPTEKDKARAAKEKANARAARIAARTKKKKKQQLSPVHKKQSRERFAYISGLEEELRGFEEDLVHTTPSKKSARGMPGSSRPHRNEKPEEQDRARRIRSAQLAKPLGMSPRSVHKLSDGQLYTTLVARQESDGASDVDHLGHSGGHRRHVGSTPKHSNARREDNGWQYNNAERIEFADEDEEQHHQRLMDAMSTIRGNSAHSNRPKVSLSPHRKKNHPLGKSLPNLTPSDSNQSLLMSPTKQLEGNSHLIYPDAVGVEDYANQSQGDVSVDKSTLDAVLFNPNYSNVRSSMPLPQRREVSPTRSLSPTKQILASPTSQLPPPAMAMKPILSPLKSVSPRLSSQQESAPAAAVPPFSIVGEYPVKVQNIDYELYPLAKSSSLLQNSFLSLSSSASASPPTTQSAQLPTASPSPNEQTDSIMFTNNEERAQGYSSPSKEGSDISDNYSDDMEPIETRPTTNAGRAQTPKSILKAHTMYESRPSTRGKHIHFCGQCTEKEATEYCKECSLNYCRDCNAEQHAGLDEDTGEDMTKHHRVSLQQEEYEPESVIMEPVFNNDASYEDSEDFNVVRASSTKLEKPKSSSPPASTKKKGPKVKDPFQNVNP